MPDDMRSLFDTHDPASDQFRLVRIQTFNWGTFAGVTDIPVPEIGFLLAGPSGSGKSTILDAHAAVLTPPKWVDFNVAAREAERRGQDRNVITYLRGAWAQQTGDSGEYVSQYLRPDTTWSAIAETYRDGHGKTVVLAQIRSELYLDRSFPVQYLHWAGRALHGDLGYSWRTHQTVSSLIA